MTDKKRGRPKGSTNKPKTFKSVEEFKEDLKKGAAKAMEEGMKEAGLVPEVTSELLAKIEKNNLPENKARIIKEREGSYDPFKNALFNKKMGLNKDK